VAEVHTFVQQHVLGFSKLSADGVAKLHGDFQEAMEDVLEAMLGRVHVDPQQLLLSLIGVQPDDVKVDLRHRACALQILSLDSEECFDVLMNEEMSAARGDPLRKACLATGYNKEWQATVRGFISANASAFAHGDGSQLEWTNLHTKYQENCEETLEETLNEAAVDATATMSALLEGPPKNPLSVTPLPARAWLPLRAFVHYQAFESMMKEGVAALS